MAIAVDENTWVKPNVFKIFSRTAQGDATLNSQKFNLARFRKFILWIKLTGVVGGPPTWTATLNHVRPEAPDTPAAGDKLAHATTLARANVGNARQQYGDWGASAALPESIGDVCVDVVIAGGGTTQGEVWMECLP